jgi:signal transduction histidine kinase
MVAETLGFGGSAAYLPRERVVEVCASRLLGLRSPLADDLEVWKGCSAQAAAVVDDCVRSMDTGRVSVDLDGVSPAAALGALMLDRGVAVQDALRAGGVLCDTVADVLDERPQPSGHHKWIALRAAQRSVATRVEAFATSYSALLLAREREQRRADRRLLARELHDYVGANISLARRHLELHRVYSDRGHSSAAQKVRAAEQVLDDVLGGTRRILQDLRAQSPVGGLSLALLSFVTSAAPDAEVGVHIAGDEWLLDDHARYEIYLICQEGLRNAFAHAGADAVTVRVDVGSTGIEAVVEDDGRGFDTTRGPAPGHHGLTSMRERAELMGGVFELSSLPGGGTRASVRVPLRRGVRSA